MARWLNLVLAPGMSLTTWALFSSGRDVGVLMQSEHGEALITPAGYAFSIWGLIYAWSVAFAVYQALPAQRDHPRLRAARPWTAAAFLLTSAWLFAALGEQLWLTVAILAGLFLALAAAMRGMWRVGGSWTATELWLARAPLGVFWGWATAAMFANLAAALKYYGWFESLLWEPGWTVALLAFATTLACWATLEMRGDVFYAAAVAWALVAIVVGNQGAGSSGLVATAAAVGGATLAGVVFVGRRRARPSPVA